MPESLSEYMIMRADYIRGCREYLHSRRSRFAQACSGGVTPTGEPSLSALIALVLAGLVTIPTEAPLMGFFSQIAESLSVSLSSVSKMGTV